MKNYRFKREEIDAMMRNIQVHSESEQRHNGKYSAWRLGLILRHNIYGGGKQKQYKAERELFLYNRLTQNDVPIFNIN